MNSIDIQPSRLTFSGHETFQCRHLWLKKGYDFISSGHSFLNEDAVLELGVGKNMVAAIRFWMKACGLTNSLDELTDFAHSLFHDETGFDPYLEDEGTLWLLHYHLVRNEFASIYSIIFNDLRKEKIEFNSISFLAFAKRLAENRKANTLNEKTILDDLGVFLKMYTRTEAQIKEIEDISSGLLVDLNLVRAKGKGKEETFFIENIERDELPCEIMLYAILEWANFETSISLNNLSIDQNRPGSVFGLSRLGIQNKIEELLPMYPELVFTDDSGIKELQVKNLISPSHVLSNYYGR